jgi:DNA-binding MarR family transcriptional regulator
MTEGSDVAQFEQLTTLVVWRHRRRIGRALSALGLTVPQFFALMFLQEHGGRCTMGDLAECTDQCSATMTGIVDRLVEMGIVTRERAPRDRRSVVVGLTTRGEELLQKAQTGRVERARQLLAHFTPEERQQIHGYLVRYLAALTEDAE